MDTAQIISAVAMLVVTVVGFLVRRSISDLDTKIELLFKKSAELDLAIRNLEKSAVRIDSLDKNMVDNTSRLSSLSEVRSEFLDRLGDFLRRGDFIRDIQIVTNQIESIHKKIEYMDSKWERLRDRQAPPTIP